MEEQRRHTLIGFLITLLGCILWGFSGTTVQYIVSETAAQAPLVTMLRMCIGGVLFMAFMLLSRRADLAKIVARPSLILKLALFSLTLYANQLCYALTVQATNAGTATVFETAGAALVMAYTCMRQAKAPQARELFGLVLAIAAAMMIATQGDMQTLAMPADGLAWALATAATAGIYVIIPKESGLLAEFGSLSVTAVGMFIAIAFAVPVYALSGGSAEAACVALASFSAGDWALFLLGAVVAGTMGGYGFYLKGISMVGPVKGSLLSAAEPVSATLFAMLWLATPFTCWDIAGLVLMCAMVAFVSKE